MTTAPRDPTLRAATLIRLYDVLEQRNQQDPDPELTELLATLRYLRNHLVHGEMYPTATDAAQLDEAAEQLQQSLQLIERSTFGTPRARQLRDQTSAETITEILARSDRRSAASRNHERPMVDRRVAKERKRRLAAEKRAAEAGTRAAEADRARADAERDRDAAVQAAEEAQKQAARAIERANELTRQLADMTKVLRTTPTAEHAGIVDLIAGSAPEGRIVLVGDQHQLPPLAEATPASDRATAPRPVEEPHRAAITSAHYSDPTTLQLLGPFALSRGGHPITPSAPKLRQVLSLLALQANSVIRDHQFVEELWEESPPPRALITVQTYISRLRKLFKDANLAAHGNEGDVDDPALLRRPGGYTLQLRSLADIDVYRFEQLAERGRQELLGGQVRAASDTMRSALALWRGNALEGLATGPLLAAHAARLEERKRTVLGMRIEADLLLGRHEEITGELASLASAEPTREDLSGKLMLALYRCGRRADALKVYQRTRTTLAELGLEPATTLQRLYQLILAADPMLDLPSERRVPPSNDADVLASALARLRHAPAEDPRFSKLRLTAQERKILDLIAQGLTIRQISGQLYLAEKTVTRTLRELAVKLRAAEADDQRGKTDAETQVWATQVRERVEQFEAQAAKARSAGDTRRAEEAEARAARWRERLATVEAHPIPRRRPRRAASRGV